MKQVWQTLVALTTTGWSLSALAHSQALHEQGALLAGFLHPLTGGDHLLAAVGVGMLAGAGPRAYALQVPLRFLLAIAAGFGLGLIGHSMAGMESLLSLTVAMVGLMLMSGRAAGVPGLAALAIALGAVHGYAHGTEAGSSAPLLFLGGLVASTLLLQFAGLALRRSLNTLSAGPPLLKAMGAVATGCGLYWLAAG
jgi:urease accessory protein